MFLNCGDDFDKSSTWTETKIFALDVSGVTLFSITIQKVLADGSGSVAGMDASAFVHRIYHLGECGSTAVKRGTGILIHLRLDFMAIYAWVAGLVAYSCINTRFKESIKCRLIPTQILFQMPN